MNPITDQIDNKYFNQDCLAPLYNYNDAVLKTFANYNENKINTSNIIENKSFKKFEKPIFQTLSNPQIESEKKPQEIESPTKNSIFEMTLSVKTFLNTDRLRAQSMLPDQQTILTDQQIEELENFISSFFRPYIAGEITSANEDKNRRPMIDLLLEKISFVNENNREIIIETAFRIYFEKAVLGFYVYTRRPVILGDIDLLSTEYFSILKALKESVPKDFPKKELSDDKLAEKTIVALFAINNMRAKALKEALDYKISGDPGMRDLYQKAEELRHSGKLFLV